MNKQKYLVIMAKEPSPGRVKTRMVPPLEAGKASLLYECFLKDTIDLVDSVNQVKKGIAYTPAGAALYFKKVSPSGFHLVSQPEGGLGHKLNIVSRHFFNIGAEIVCMINSDGPDLPPSYIKQAFNHLAGGEIDVVFGPNPDGGYYLVGLRKPMDIFKGIKWGTGKVLQESTIRTKEKGLKHEILPLWPDLDTVEDLREALQRWHSGKVSPPRLTYPMVSSLLSSLEIP